MTESLQNEVCIVIPIYKVEPSISETESLRQCFRVLGKHAICLVTPEDLNLYWYNDIIEGAFTNQNWKVEYFEKSYFISIKGYNSLMLSEKFYERFKEFKYILIYQLDCWIFKDELLLWCKKDYDYIGGPWLDNYWSDFYSKHLTLPRTIANKLGYKNFNLVGNGGLSLRKVRSFVFNLKLFKLKALKFPYNEDYFFSFFITSYNPFFKVPKFKEALQFAFDENPAKAWNLNNGKLPMGCHGWPKYKSFWNFFLEQD